jgi:alpha-amylase
VDAYDVPELTSWADTERDVSAWLGNAMQTNAAEELYDLEEAVKDRHASGDEHLLDDWRMLTSSDHLYYMSTKHWEDGAVHRYFSPYDSPYDAYINFMNVLDDIRTRAAAR